MSNLWLYIILFVWATISLTMLLGFSEIVEELSTIQLILFTIIIIIGSPFLFISQIFILLLDLILPEGWDDDFL